MLPVLPCSCFCCFVTAAYDFKQKVFLKCTWILTGIVLVIEHLKYSKTLCVAENSIVLAKPEMLTLFQLGAGHGGETHSITILLLTYLLP